MDINKQELYYKCLDKLDERIKKYNEEMRLVQETREASNPSTDPDEQGGQGEMMGNPERIAEQLDAAQQMKENLANLDIKNTSAHVRKGSVVETEENYFFISEAIGKISLEEGSSVYTVSPQAPIYQHLEGKTQGDSFTFKDKAYTIVKVH